MILLLEPVLFDKIWGGDAFARLYDFPSGPTCGEAWGISGHKNGSSIVRQGSFQGRTLRDLYQHEPALFGHPEEREFPILVKLISAADDLSIQVHPNDEQAKRLDSLGKEECWTILEAEDTDILIGHTATSKNEIRSALADNTILSLLRRHPIQAGDFFYIEAGTVHAIRKGTTLLEVQQSSDITYRLYDYLRPHNGALRELHIDEALECMTIPDKPILRESKETHFHYGLRQNDGLRTHIADDHGDYIFVMNGEGTFDDLPVQAGTFLMVSAKSTYTVQGNLHYQISTF